MRVLVCLLALLTGAVGHALTFQFLLRSTRTATVETRFDMAKRSPDGSLVVVGRAGKDLLVQKWDSNGNLLVTKTFDGPDKATENPVDVDVDNLNAIWVVYETGVASTRLVRFDLNLNVVFDIPAGIPGEAAKKIVVSAAREGIYGGVGVDARDTFAAKVSGAGSQKWRRLVGRIRFFDADARPGGDGLIMVGRNTTTEQGVITAFRDLDGARPFTFQTTVAASARNAIMFVATNREAGVAFAAGFTNEAQPVHALYRIAADNVVSSGPANISVDNVLVGVATSQTSVTAAAVAAALPGGGGVIVPFDANLVISPGASFTSPTPNRVAVDRLGGSAFVSGLPVVVNFIEGGLVKQFQMTDFSISSEYRKGFGVSEDITDLADIGDFAVTAVGRETLSGSTKGLMVRMNASPEWRITNLVEQHPTRTVIDSATDASGAHFTLIKLGTIEGPSLVVKRSPSGPEVWQVRLQDEGFVPMQPAAIAVGPNGNVIVAGVLPSAGDLGTWIVQCLSPTTGATLWKKTIGFPANGIGFIKDLVVSATNEILVGGSTSQAFGTQDIATARLLSNGTVRWTRVMGGAFQDSAHRIAFLPNGSCVVWGFFDERFPRLTFYSATGATISDLALNGGNTATGDSLAVEPDGVVVVANGVDGTVFLRRIRSDGTILSDVAESSSSAPTVAATSNGQPWFIRKLATGVFRASRLSGTSFIAELDLPANTSQVAGAVAHSDDSVVYTAVTVNPSTQAVASYVARHLASGPRAAQRNFAGTVKSLARAPDGSAWASGDQLVQNQGTELFMAKYAVP